MNNCAKQFKLAFCYSSLGSGLHRLGAFFITIKKARMSKGLRNEERKMKTNVRDSSRDCYHSGQAKFGAQTSLIVNFMRDNPGKAYTRREIAHFTGIEMSSVSARVNQLVKDSDLVELPRRKCSITGISSHEVVLSAGVI